jgi:hypothetical protein
MNSARDEVDVIECAELTTWAVPTDGSHVRMEFKDAKGKSQKIIASIEVVSSLLMTFPRMLQTALDARSSDSSLRVVQRLGDWRIEEAEGNSDLILRLETRDGFEVAFASNGRDADALSDALRSALQISANRTRWRPN